MAELATVIVLINEEECMADVVYHKSTAIPGNYTRMAGDCYECESDPTGIVSIHLVVPNSETGMNEWADITILEKMLRESIIEQLGDDA